MNLIEATEVLQANLNEWNADKISNEEFAEQINKIVYVLSALAAEQHNKDALASDMSSYRTTLLATEAEALAAALKTLNDNVDKNAVISFGPQTVFDENGETLGRINFNGDAMAYVLEMDYIPENHTDA